jgi:hypothetical protein
LTVVVGVSSADGIEHVLGGVGFRGTLGAAVGLEVVDQILGVMAERAVEDDATAGLEEEELVEVLKEDGGGLMDGAKDSLACVGELTEETNDVEGCAGVETRGRFVEEHEEFRLGS